MDRIRAVIEEAKEAERELLTKRASSRSQLCDWRYAIGIGGLSTFLLLSVGGGFLVRSVTRPVREAAHRLAAAVRRIGGQQRSAGGRGASARLGRH